MTVNHAIDMASLTSFELILRAARHVDEAASAADQTPRPHFIIWAVRSLG